MFLTPEVLAPFCAATEWFVNLPSIDSTEQVESGIQKHIRPLMQPVQFPDGTRLEPIFFTIEPQHVGAYRNDQLTLLAMLRRAIRLPSPLKHRYHWLERSSELRKELGPLLERMPFTTTTAFDESGRLRIVPVRFGLESVIYMTIAELLEPDTKVKVAKCSLKTCGRYVLYAHTGRGKPRRNCPDHAQKKRNQERRSPEMSKNVWLVQWEHVGDHAKPKQKVAMILPGDFEISLVKTIVEQHYSAETSTPDEMLDYAVGGENPYPAEVHRLAKGGYSVVCGHNPHLEARLVPSAESAKELVRRETS